VRKIEVFVPGKVMLAGEYAVLRGGHALGCALSCGMTIEVVWDSHATSWIVESDVWNAPQIFEGQAPLQTDILCRAVSISPMAWAHRQRYALEFALHS
jgi:mevalonate kinase